MAPKPKPIKTKKKKNININDADYWFSLCVRERANWKCENCGKSYAPEYNAKGLPGNRALHCSHYIGRGNYSVRFDPMNADAHCYGCHSKFESNPHEFMSWKYERLGGILYDILIEKSNDLSLGKIARGNKAEVAEHYRNEYYKMQELRKTHSGRISFQGYL